MMLDTICKLGVWGADYWQQLLAGGAGQWLRFNHAYFPPDNIETHKGAGSPTRAAAGRARFAFNWALGGWLSATEACGPCRAWSDNKLPQADPVQAALRAEARGAAW